ncbi:MAG: type II toxin-antitoxin system HicB family antitoxin [Vicinamibacterales bacterium]|nr:type II toxin-antitoxin system HicB family antitoxin [Vicinamibacterales bacterium]
MIDLPYSLVIEATGDPSFYGFHAPDLAGFTGTGTSVEDCIEKARAGIDEHVALLVEHGLPVPPPTPEPTITVHNERRLADASGF